MVQLQEVYRYILRPVELRMREWEKKPGLKGKLSRIFRIGKAPPSWADSLAKISNYIYMKLIMFTHRPWGPVYKRLFEFDINPGRLLFLFCRHRGIYFFWFGNYFLVEDQNYIGMMSKDPDYLAYYTVRYHRIFPRNTLNWRTSAHYLEISRIFTFEMMKKCFDLEQQYWEEHLKNKALEMASSH